MDLFVSSWAFWSSLNFISMVSTPQKYYSISLILLALSCSSSGNKQLVAIRTAEGIEIQEAGSKVLFYQSRPKSLNGKYERANYIHPLYSLDGNVLTEDFPEDHPHHRGIFWAWHQMLIANKPAGDGWSCENVFWDVRDTKVAEKENSITLENEVVWKSDKGGPGQIPVVKENSNITVWQANDRYRIIDFDIKLVALVDSLKIGGSDDAKGYSGFSVRFKLPKDIRFVAENKEVTAQELGIEAGPWMDFEGSFDGAGQPTSGVAVFCHPSNPGHPQPWILRSEKSMQNPAYPGRVPVSMTREGWHFRYRMVVHKNDVNTEEIKELYKT
jgi:hypothetical protein